MLARWVLWIVKVRDQFPNDYWAGQHEDAGGLFALTQATRDCPAVGEGLFGC